MITKVNIRFCGRLISNYYKGLVRVVYFRGSQTFGVMEPLKRLTIIYGAHNKFLKIKTKKTHCYLPIDIPE